MADIGSNGVMEQLPFLRTQPLKEHAMRHTNCKSVATHIRQYSEAIDAASLPLIKAVDNTIDALASIQKMLTPFIRLASMEAEKIYQCENGKPIDADGIISEHLLKNESNLNEAYTHFSECLKAAYADQELTGHNESSVVDEYNNTLEVFVELHDATRDLRWAIMEHDANVSEVTGEFDNIEDLMKHLKAV